MIRSIACVVGALGAALLPRLASAQLTGVTLGGEYRFPDAATVLQDLGTAVVGPGVEFTAIGQLQADVGDASLTIRGIPGTGPVALLPTGFSGFRIYDVGGTAPDFLSVTLNGATNVPGFDIGRVTWNGDEILVNLQDLVLLPGQAAVLTLGFGPTTTVPEPATVALVATGLLGVATTARRRTERGARV